MPAKPKYGQRIDIRLTADQIKNLKEVQKNTGLKISELIRRAIATYTIIETPKK